jgi:hypothetical protein
MKSLGVQGHLLLVGIERNIALGQCALTIKITPLSGSEAFHLH